MIQIYNLNKIIKKGILVKKNFLIMKNIIKINIIIIKDHRMILEVNMLLLKIINIIFLIFFNQPEIKY